MNLSDAEAEMRRLSDLIDRGVAELRAQAQEYAVAEDEYRMARAAAYVTSEGTVEARKAEVDLATSEERRRAHLAEGMRQAALEAIRARRAQLSAWQSMMNAFRAEADLASTGPR